MESILYTISIWIYFILFFNAFEDQSLLYRLKFILHVSTSFYRICFSSSPRFLLTWSRHKFSCFICLINYYSSSCNSVPKSILSLYFSVLSSLLLAIQYNFSSKSTFWSSSHIFRFSISILRPTNFLMIIPLSFCLISIF